MFLLEHPPKQMAQCGKYNYYIHPIAILGFGNCAAEGFLVPGIVLKQKTPPKGP
jgi:hypothetical protein